MNKILSLFSVFKLGSQVLNPAAWKARQVDMNMIGGFFIGVVNLLPLVGVPIPPILTPDIVNMVAGSVLAVANTALTIATTTKMGVAPACSNSPKPTLIPGVIATNAETQPAKVNTIAEQLSTSGNSAVESTNELTQMPAARVGGEMYVG